MYQVWYATPSTFHGHYQLPIQDVVKLVIFQPPTIITGPLASVGFVTMISLGRTNVTRHYGSRLSTSFFAVLSLCVVLHPSFLWSSDCLLWDQLPAIFNGAVEDPSPTSGHIRDTSNVSTGVETPSTEFRRPSPCACRHLHEASSATHDPPVLR